MFKNKYLTTRATLMLGGIIGGALPVLAQDPGGVVPPISLVYYAADIGIEHEQSARILSEDWAKLGLTFELQPIQFGTFVSTINVGGQLEDMAVVVVGADPDRIDPTYWLYDSSACGSRRNAAKWCDEDYTALAEAQRGQIDAAARLEAVHQLQEIHHEAAPWWPVSHSIYGILWNKERWSNITSSVPLAPHEGLLNPWLTATPLTEDRILDWAYLEDVNGYNPLAEESAVGWVRNIFDTFAKTDETGQTIPWAAESWEYTDDTTLRITLRGGMTFHDGTPVTAADAVFTLSKAVEVQPPSMVARINNIADVTQIDELTFTVKLSEPDAAFVPNSLTFLFILPQHLWADYEGDFVDRDIVADGVVIGSGPFQFKTWRPNEIHELTTHTDHWAAPDYDGIRRLALGQSDAVRAAMAGGTADIATAVLPVSAMSDMAMMEDHLDFLEVPTHSSQLTWVNNEKAPFNDRAFRHALRMATNRDRVVLEAYQGFNLPAGAGPVPNILTTWYNPDLAPVVFDVEGARAILSEAGYSWDDQGRLLFPQN